jgi:predicted dehydrogenase
VDNSRRSFLKQSGISGAGLIGIGSGMNFVRSGYPSDGGIKDLDNGPHRQRFNMCGYAAPKLDVVRIGFIGLGQRGPGHMMNMTRVEGAQVAAVCDIRPEYANRARARAEKRGHHPEVYAGTNEIWKKVCERDDLDAIYIATPWDLHTPIALYAMEQGKHAFIEVPAAVTLDECWQLVETSERTKKHCMMLENDCYGFFQLLTLNMARQGFFGDVVHCEGAYIHNLLHLNFDKDGYWNMWRLKQNARRNGNLYPTHGLGPVCQIMNINRGDKLEYLTSMSGVDYMMAAKAKALGTTDEFFKPYMGNAYRGDMNSSFIRTQSGRTIMVQHDVSSPNVYTRIHKVVGTKGTAMEFPEPGWISDGGEEWLTGAARKAVEDKYQPPIVKRVGELAKQIGGHGGKDFILDWRVIDCLRNGLPLDEDVYDAAMLSCISPLSEWSVANRSRPVKVPDFTCESWNNNEPVDIDLKRGGNTKIMM